MFYTGDGLTARVARYAIDILDEPWLIENINGALGYLGVTTNWEEKGVVTAEEAAERSNDALVTFRRYDDVGEVRIYATAVMPADTLPCDGATYLRVDYPELYSVLDSFLIVDADSFTVPSLGSSPGFQLVIVAR